jgi:hypothetical protein
MARRRLAGVAALSMDRLSAPLGARGGDTAADARPTSLRLNRPSQGRAAMGRGRTRGLPASAAHLLVQRWIDDATEWLSSMRYTCALDVADDHPSGITESSVAMLLGVSPRAISVQLEGAMRKVRAASASVE